MYRRVLSLAILLAAPDAALAQGGMAAAYERAAKVIDANLATAIRNPEVTPHWIEDGKAFWYRRDGEAGPEWMLVDAATGAKAAAFDTAALRGALGRTVKADAIPAVLPVSALDRTGVTLAFPAGAIRCLTATLECSPVKAPARSPETSWAPSGGHGVLARDHNLWLRDGAGAEPVALTSDGVANFAYGASPDTSLFAIPIRRSTAPMPPSGITWSPDGRYFISDRVDQRGVETYPFVEAVPQDGGFRPRLWPLRIPLLGDPEPDGETAIFDVAKRGKTLIALPDGWQPYRSAFHWPAGGGIAYGLAITRAARNIGLMRIDLATGQTRLVISEATPKWGRFNAFIYSQPNVRILDATNEAVWFSERDGWGQLYLYDLGTGKLKRKLTTGARTVRDIVGIDERRRRIVYTAGGTDRDEDPYFVRLYSVSLDGGREKLLTPERGVHLAARQPIGNSSPGSASIAALSPDGAHIVESYSSLDAPPVSVLRSALDGRVIATLENADVSQVTRAGWRAPLRVRTVAADGATPLWGTIYFPRDMQAGRKYPVIDAIYGGPQVTNAPADYREAVVTMNPRSRASLAELGFIVVTIDGRGTPGRSKDFNNASYEDFASPELADHVAGIRQLAERFGNFDLDRVGIYGHSFGGYTSARAILTYPDFYKVAVSSAGPLNFQGFYPVDGIFPLPDYGKSGPARPNATAVPENYARLDLMPLARNLKGKLLLAYGELDENALPSVTHQFIDALIKANKPYDLMYLPNQSHGFFRTSAYYTQRMWDYFVEHLMHETPPADFRLQLAPMPIAAGF